MMSNKKGVGDVIEQYIPATSICLYTKSNSFSGISLCLRFMTYPKVMLTLIRLL